MIAFKLATVLLVTSTLGCVAAQGCDQDQEDRPPCLPPMAEELQDIPSREIFVALPCKRDLTASEKEEAAKALQQNKAASESVQEIEKLVESEELSIVPYYSYRPVCPSWSYWQRWSRLVYLGSGDYARCYSSTPIHVTYCTRKTCDFKYNYYYRSVCLREYCRQFVWAVCFPEKGPISIRRLLIRYPCCCKCKHLSYYFGYHDKE